MPQLGHVKTIGDAFGIGQHTLARAVERLSHIHAVAVYLRTLLGRQALQAGTAGRFITSGLDRQQPRSRRIGQVGQHRHVQLVPLLQADLVHADIANHTLRINRLGILQLVLHDTADRLCRDTQTPGHVFLAATDQQPHHVFLEGVGIARVLTLEGRDQILAMMAVWAAVEDPLVDPETGLVPHFQVPHHALLAVLFEVGLVFVTAALTPAALGPGPGDLEAVAVAMAFVARDFHALGQINVNGDAGHGRPWQRVPRSASSTRRTFQLSTIESPCQRGNPEFPGFCT